MRVTLPTWDDSESPVEADGRIVRPVWATVPSFLLMPTSCAVLQQTWFVA